MQGSLQAMKLRERSDVDKIFASWSSPSSQPICERDVDDDQKLNDGNTQDLLYLLDRTRAPVILVVIDYAGLSTNTEDLLQFISKYKKLEKIVVDRIPVTCEVEILSRHQLLNDKAIINKFNCRNRPVKRSL
ncbi:uncharacterized protein BX664DRAFT_332116 [Halteromyces radiatus]|uniref:uncharacterized protein n=1 Tax=Halteromyces radiatus TaxID=101107 RepID=UPI00221F07F8|nr:uncharacterized protein BX664DRAFT_332116 [Halteromyces radiatus]KAI8089079.1 hypothetical protein BX664DRAFT_332116 [Halteromyces radiatus]